MGEVYRARDTRLGRDVVALKILPDSFARNEDRLHRFEQESRAVAALNHPNILAIHDVGQHNGCPGFRIGQAGAGHGRCLEKSPEQRFQSAKDLSFALSALSGTEASGAARATAAVPREIPWLRWALTMVALAEWRIPGPPVSEIGHKVFPQPH